MSDSSDCGCGNASTHTAQVTTIATVSQYLLIQQQQLEPEREREHETMVFKHSLLPHPPRYQWGAAVRTSVYTTLLVLCYLLLILQSYSSNHGMVVVPVLQHVQAFSSASIRTPTRLFTDSRSTAHRKDTNRFLLYRPPFLVSQAQSLTVLQDVMYSSSGSTGSAGTSDSSGSSSYYNNDPMNNRHSASDWLYNVRSLPESKVLREIRNPVLSVFVWSLFVSVIYTTFHKSSIRILNAIATNMCIPGTAHSFLVSALGLLLVFRTNSAYQRFNEGRKIWEHILSVSRNLSRFLSLYDHEIGYEKQRRMMNLVAAYPYLLRQHIRPGCLCSNNSQHIPPEYRLLLKEQRRTQHETRHEGPQQHSSRGGTNRFYNKNINHQRIANEENDDDNDSEFMLPTNNSNKNNQNNDDDSISLFGKKLQLTYAQQVQPTNTDVDCWVDRRSLPWSLFIPQSLPAISTAENRPLWVCDRMAALICKIPYGPNFTSRERLVLLGMVDKLTNAIGQCERIHQTAVPLNYARHSLRSLTLWLFTLPFALVQDLGLLTAFANAVIAWLFFGVYQIGYSIEDPFQGSLRLSILCDAIRRSVIRQPSTTYPDEDPNSPTAAYSPEECLNLYASSKDGSIPEECLLYNNIPSLTDVIRRSVKSEESMSLSIEETMILQQQEKLSLQQQMSSKVQQDQGHRNDTSSSTSNNTNVPLSMPSLATGATSKTVWSLDEEMLATPKIVTYKNGTWTEIGI